MSLTLSQVLTIASVEEWKARILSFATSLGLSATAWQPGGVARTIIAVFANAFNAQDDSSYDIAAGGFLETAAEVTQEGGPGWLDLVAQYVFGATREEATQGTTTITITNTGGAIGPLAVGAYHIRIDSSGNTYRNSAVLTINNGSNTGVAFICDATGETDAAGEATTPITTYSGVSTGTLDSAATGRAVETNAALVARCRDKTGAFAPKLGGASSYRYYALTSTEPDYPLPDSPITRINVVANSFTGAVAAYIANSSGAPSGGDVADMQTYLDSVATPDGEQLTVIAATEVDVDLVTNIWCPSAYAAQLTADVTAAWTAYIAALAIGGETLETSGSGVSLEGWENYLARTVTYIRTQTTTFNGAATPVSLSANQVATTDAITVTRAGA